jgi:hypothetical protein
MTRLTERHKQARVEFCQHQTRDPFPFPIIFTDESTVALNLNKGGLWRIRGHRIEQEHYIMDAHPLQVMVWGAIGPGGWRSPLIKCPESVTRDSYLQFIYQEGVITMMKTAFPGGFIFQQDNAPAHTAARSALESVLLILNWPAKSPDLSPIEQIWAYLKKQLKGRYFRSEDDLFAALQEEWRRIPDELIDNYWTSFRFRCQVCLELNGESLNGHWKRVHELHHPKVAST